MKYFILLILLTISFSLYSQNDEKQNPYDIIISYHIDYLAEYYKSLDEKIIYIKGDTKLPLNSITSYKGYKIVFLNSNEIINKAKKQAFIISFIEQVVLRNNGFTINIVDFTVKYKRKKLNLSNLGSESFDFEYDCEKEEFVLMKNK